MNGGRSGIRYMNLEEGKKKRPEGKNRGETRTRKQERREPEEE